MQHTHNWQHLVAGIAPISHVASCCSCCRCCRHARPVPAWQGGYLCACLLLVLALQLPTFCTCIMPMALRLWALTGSSAAAVLLVLLLLLRRLHSGCCKEHQHTCHAKVSSNVDASNSGCGKMVGRAPPPFSWCPCRHSVNMHMLVSTVPPFMAVVSSLGFCSHKSGQMLTAVELLTGIPHSHACQLLV